MSPTYICGFDGSPAARRALRLTAHLARAADAQPIAVTVVPEPRPGGARRHLGRFQRGGEAIASEINVPGVRHEIVEADSAARGLHEAAAQLRAELVAIGASEHSWMGRIVTGTTAHNLLHGAPCPVAVVPPESAAAPRTIAVAYDGRAESAAALEAARTLARDLAGRLLVLTAVDPRPFAALGSPGLPYVAGMIEAQREDAQAELARIAADSDADTLLLEGPAGQALAEACRAHGVELLVCGSRGYGPLRSVLLGSVSRHLVDHAPCAVVVTARARESAPVAAAGVGVSAYGEPTG